MRSLWLAAAAPPDWMQIVPPFGFMRHHLLADVGADLVVVRADIGEAQPLVLGQQVRIPGQDRDAGGLGALQRIGDGGRIGGRDRDAVDLLGDQVGHDLGLLVAAAMFARADVEALDRALQLPLGLLAAGQRLVVERVVHALGHQREGHLLAGRRGAAGRTPA